MTWRCPRYVVDGTRQNTGLVYLTEDVRRRPNLRIVGDVTIDRALFDGRTAVGVAADGTTYRARQVILSPTGGALVLAMSVVQPDSRGSVRLRSRDPLDAQLAGELVPGDSVADDAALLDSIETTIATYGHPTTTAPMGGEGDPGAVVDSTGAVRGIAGLRVIDASILPRVPSVAPNLTVIGVAEHLAAVEF